MYSSKYPKVKIHIVGISPSSSDKDKALKRAENLKRWMLEEVNYISTEQKKYSFNEADLIMKEATKSKYGELERGAVIRVVKTLF